MDILLAIDTSCDETAVSLFNLECFLDSRSISQDLILSEIISSQIKLHQAYGGVVPELAAREHLANLTPILGTALREAGAGYEDIKAIAVTRGPGLNGCLLVGFCFAKSFAYARNIPIIAVNHIEGHLFASELMGDSYQLQYPAMALIVSGGHTTLLSIKGFRNYQVVAQTRDDAAGEAFDKCATAIGLPYPGGPILSKKAEKGDKKSFRLPIGLPNDNKSFSFSGLKTAVVRLVKNLEDKIHDSQICANVCASVEEAIVTALVSKSIEHVKAYNPRHFVLAGGVASNTRLRHCFAQELQSLNVTYVVPPSRWCTDNASMIGILGLKIIAHELDSNGNNNFSVIADKYSSLNISKLGSLPRWPINKLFTV